MNRTRSAELEGAVAEILLDRGQQNAWIAEVGDLMAKPARREIEVDVRWVGFEIPNRFVIGYGLDFAERYRNLPYVGVLSPELVPESAFFFSSRRRHTRFDCDWSSDVCSSD